LFACFVCADAYLTQNTLLYCTQAGIAGGTSALLAEHLFNRAQTIGSFLNNVKEFVDKGEEKIEPPYEKVRLPLAVVPGAPGYGKVRCLPLRFSRQLIGFVCLISFRWFFVPADSLAPASDAKLARVAEAAHYYRFEIHRCRPLVDHVQFWLRVAIRSQRSPGPDLIHVCVLSRAPSTAVFPALPCSMHFCCV